MADQGAGIGQQAANRRIPPPPANVSNQPSVSASKRERTEQLIGNHIPPRATRANALRPRLSQGRRGGASGPIEKMVTLRTTWKIGRVRDKLRGFLIR